ncbi:phage major capsid protein [Pontixanthobacter gangjinensis]|uniref:Phage major capsid protein n=1 Tax=Pontixanthobacter gangjinensis TaxID=1028742 RepID=A0A6I4SN09_9SPHN|nr:phage major capsid protein [Pontixanthobacter gangjinensis]MXO57175.1 phage major capsid protein [Pontixanthobacter gangjinensis]
MTTQTKTIQELAAETKAALLAPSTELKFRMDEMEQKFSAIPSGGFSSQSQSWGAQVTDSDELKTLSSVIGSQPGRVRIEMKDITSASGSAGGFATPMLDGNVNALPGRMPRMRDVLNVVNTVSGSVEYLDQVTRTNGAAPQVEGAMKGESNYEWELRNLPIQTIAHWTRQTVQILSDAPQLQSVIDTEMRYGLAIEEENQILSGSGISPNLNGLITNATPFAADFTPASETMIDKVGLGVLQVALAEFMPNGIAVHPSDWMRMRLLKDADGKYLLGDPGADVRPVLFGLPVIGTTAIPKDKFLIGDFMRAATLYDRQAPTVALSTEDRDNFTTNRVTIRVESRLALAIKQPLATSYGDFGNTP